MLAAGRDGAFPRLRSVDRPVNAFNRLPVYSAPQAGVFDITDTFIILGVLTLLGLLAMAVLLLERTSPAVIPDSEGVERAEHVSKATRDA